MKDRMALTFFLSGSSEEFFGDLGFLNEPLLSPPVHSVLDAQTPSSAD